MPGEVETANDEGAVIKSFYSTILSQIFSPCGNFLLAGNIYGEIFVFDLKNILNPEHEVQETKQKPHLKFLADENGQVRSMASTEKFLIVGSNGKILAFEWKYIVHGKIPKVAWIINVPPLKDAVEVIEVNCVVIAENQKIFSGCGDGKIHIHSMEDGRLIRSLSEHKDYIHDLALIEKETFGSAGEDGSLYIWDYRTSKLVSSIEPYKESSLHRPSLGKWLGFINAEKDWLLCGGGPKPGLWHLGTMQLTTVFDMVERGIHTGKIHEERIMIGSSNKLMQYTLQGDFICSVPTSCSTIYSLVLQSSPYHLMAIAGSSRNVELCTNLNYKDQVLTCM